MAGARVTEIIASSDTSFDGALKDGIKRANKTLKNLKGAWIKDQQVELDGKKYCLLQPHAEGDLCPR